jgi:hypothetical protein
MKEIVKRQDDQEQGRELEPPGRRPSWWRYPVSVGVASSIVYGAVILGWMALVVWGLVSLLVAECACPEGARPSETGSYRGFRVRVTLLGGGAAGHGAEATST